MPLLPSTFLRLRNFIFHTHLTVNIFKVAAVTQLTVTQLAVISEEARANGFMWYNTGEEL